MEDQSPVLVLGATGFLGRHVVTALRARGRTVRCMARNPDRATNLAGAGVELVEGDFLVPGDVDRAVDGASAVIVCVHTISFQASAGEGQDFMDVEAVGIGNVIAACSTHGVNRVLYVTSIGVAEGAASSWLRGRWRTEQSLFSSGLDATAVRPGMIVGKGGDGFGIVARGATGRFAMAIGSPRQRFRTIAVDDLANDMVDLLASRDAVGQSYDVGSDDVLTMREMMSIAALSIGRRRAVTMFVPAGVIRVTAPLIERLTRVPKGSLRGLVGDGPRQDMIGDPTPERTVLGRIDRPFQESIVGQLR